MPGEGTKFRALCRLACGTPTGGTQLSEIIEHLCHALGALVDEMATMSAGGAEPDLARRSALYGPFLGRSVLEIVSTALIGRLDPFRVLTLRQIQLQPTYKLGLKTRAAIQWSGDVMAEGKPEKLWTTDRTFAEMTRALLGDYQDHVLWRPAFERFLDAVPPERGGEWMRSVRQIQPEGFLASMRTRFGAAFSECSKGVHHELLIAPSSLFTPETIRELHQRVLEITSILAAVFNACDYASFRLPVDDVIAGLESMQESLDCEGTV